MQPHPRSAPATPPFRVSLRIRHPSIDPAEIAKALELSPEHSFKAGEPRSSRDEDIAPARHTQTYWLAPIDSYLEQHIEPSFLEQLAEKYFAETHATSSERMEEMMRRVQIAKCTVHVLPLDNVLFASLARLNLRQEFLRRLQEEGGEVSLLVALDPRAMPNFALSVAVTRFLAKLGIGVEFELG